MIDWTQDGTPGFNEKVVRAASTQSNGYTRWQPNATWESRRKFDPEVQAYERKHNPKYLNPIEDTPSIFSPLGDRSHHFTTEAVMSAIGENATDYAKAHIRSMLSLITSGERFALYRAIKTLCSKPGSEPSKSEPIEETLVSLEDAQTYGSDCCNAMSDEHHPECSNSQKPSGFVEDPISTCEHGSPLSVHCGDGEPVETEDAPPSEREFEMFLIELGISSGRHRTRTVELVNEGLGYYRAALASAKRPGG